MERGEPVLRLAREGSALIGRRSYNVQKLGKTKRVQKVAASQAAPSAESASRGPKGMRGGRLQSRTAHNETDILATVKGLDRRVAELVAENQRLQQEVEVLRTQQQNMATILIDIITVIYERRCPIPLRNLDGLCQKYLGHQPRCLIAMVCKYVPIVLNMVDVLSRT